jgi:FkbM family methyltransferase
VKFFIDCGAHQGESVRLFRRDYPNAVDYKVVSFEPNPGMFPANNFPDVTYHQVAVWTENTEVTFYQHEWSVGFSVYNSHPKSCRDGQFAVKAIDFSEWLKQNVTADDYVVLKMDIEGSEYKVLRKMFDDGTIDLIDKLYIEFHDHWMRLEEGVHATLVADLEAKGLHPYNWNAAHNHAFIESPDVE